MTELKREEALAWLRSNWRWIAFGIILAIILWGIGQKVAAVGSALAALWKWIFSKGKEFFLSRKIEATKKEKEANREQMNERVKEAADDAKADDAKIDKQVEELAKPGPSNEADKADTIKMLDQLDDEDKTAASICRRCHNQIKQCVCPPSIRNGTNS